MTLSELYNQLAPSFPDFARKNFKTAIHVLAAALGYPDPEHCSSDQFNRPLPELYTLVETYLLADKKKPKKPHTIRNIKNYLSRLFRLAEAQHLFSFGEARNSKSKSDTDESDTDKLVKKYARSKMPKRPRLQPCPVPTDEKTTLLYNQWPSDLQHSFDAFTSWATADYVPGRNATFKKRQKTIEGYRTTLESYFGFLYHHEHRSTLSFEDLFDLELIQSYVSWHINDYRGRPTVTLQLFFKRLLALTRQYNPSPALRVQLLELQKTIDSADPTYDKKDASVPMDTLRKIGLTLYPSIKPQDIPKDKRTAHPGIKYAAHASLGLVLRLWCYIPYRSRNIREMKIDKNLYKTKEGHWRIVFRGEELKVARRGKQQNVFDLLFPPPLVPLLEDYLLTWRPILLAKSSKPLKEVFINSYGNPYKKQYLRDNTRLIVYEYTGQQWHPHQVRSDWAIEWVKGGGDLHRGAEMMNDTLEVFTEKYASFRPGGSEKEVYERLDKIRIKDEWEEAIQRKAALEGLTSAQIIEQMFRQYLQDE